MTKPQRGNYVMSDELAAKIMRENKNSPRELDFFPWIRLLMQKYHAEKTRLRPIDEWEEDMNDVLCWTVPVSESPVITLPISSDYPESTTHFSELLLPSNLSSDGFDIKEG